MRIETVVIITKGAVVALSASASALVGSLAQWSNTDSRPTDLQWVIIGATTIGAGAAAFGGWLSSSFGKYLQARSNGAVAIEPPKP